MAENFYNVLAKKNFLARKKNSFSLLFITFFFHPPPPPATLATLVFANYTPFPPSNSYLLGLLAKIKCSICSYQLNF